MIARIFALFIIVFVLYVSLIFIKPDIADRYGNQAFNDQVRMIKRASELDRNFSDTGSLAEKVSDIAKPYIEESKNAVNTTKETIEAVSTLVNIKKEQVIDVSKSAVDTINKAGETKTRLDTLTTFGTGK